MRENQNVARGLENVSFAESKLTFINGNEGILLHLGISIQDWAQKSSFEELSLALLLGHLPKQDELDDFKKNLLNNREISEDLEKIIKQMPKTAHPMQVLRTAFSYQGLLDENSEDISEEARLQISIKMIAQMSTIIAYMIRCRSDQEIIRPNKDLDHAANFLYMLNGIVPSEEQARLFDMALILHADHGMNASTFTAIATSSTLTDMYSVITSAIGALKGPLHGGANEQVMVMLDEIDDPEKAAQYIENKLNNKEKIMGVGHRVYKNFDPRSRVLRDYAAMVADKEGKSNYYQILENIEKIVVQRIGSKGIYPNVDFYSGVVYSDLGIKQEYFTPIFVLARISGWCASVLEYSKNNRLLRPDAAYTGELNAEYVPIDKR